ESPIGIVPTMRLEGVLRLGGGDPEEGRRRPRQISASRVGTTHGPSARHLPHRERRGVARPHPPPLGPLHDAPGRRSAPPVGSQSARTFLWVTPPVATSGCEAHCACAA